MPKKMRVVQVSQPKGPFEIVEREIPEPQAGWVRVKVEACGICHSDSLTKEGHWPGIQYPRVPGHEVIGVIDAAGPAAAGWTAGQRVGIGWHASHCDPCRRGDFFACQVAKARARAIRSCASVQRALRAGKFCARGRITALSWHPRRRRPNEEG